MYRDYISELNIRAENILVYLRKSRADDPLLTVEEVLQKHESILNEWIERNIGEEIPETNRFREIVSGETIADRPEIQKVLKLMESPKIKAILAVEVQRLSRGDLEDCGRLIKLLRYTNTLVITPQKIYDLTDEYDRDSFERELKRGNEFLEYQKKIMGRGRLLSVSQGNYIGSIAPYGYKKTWITEGKRKCPTLSINEEQANVVRMVYDMYANKNLGQKRICDHLNKLGITPKNNSFWTVETISDMLRNPHYIGKVIWNRKKTITLVQDGEVVKSRPIAHNGDYLVFDGKHEAIISEELYNKVQEKRGRTPRVQISKKLVNPFAGLIVCQCGTYMVQKPPRKINGVTKAQTRLMCRNQTHCNTKSCTIEEMTDIVADILRNNIKDFKVQLKNSNKDEAQLQAAHLKTLKIKLEELEAKELSMWETQTMGALENRMPQDIFQKLNSKLQQEKKLLREQIKTTQETIPTIKYYEERIERFQDALDALLSDEVDVPEKNTLLKQCIEKIIYSRAKSYRIKNNDNNNEKGWSITPILIETKLKI